MCAVKARQLLTCISYKRLTPVVVSSDTPTMDLAMAVQRLGRVLRPSRMSPSTILNSGLSVESGLGTVPSLAKAASALTPSAERTGNGGGR